MIQTVYTATSEVASAILTAVMTTIVSFLPVFTLQAAEGKLFGPLAWTKTFALVAALLFTIVFMPAFAHWVLGIRKSSPKWKKAGNGIILSLGIIALFILPLAGVVLILLALNNLLDNYYGSPGKPYEGFHTPVLVAIAVGAVSWVLAKEWLPLGVSVSPVINFLFILLIIGIVLGGFSLFIRYYPRVLKWCLAHKAAFLSIPAFIMLIGITAWLGFSSVFGWVATGFDKVGWNIRTTAVYSGIVHTFPGMGKEFMPALDEGAFLLMPTSMPHSGVEANQRILQQLDMLATAIPEVKTVVGKAGRAETALDPAPMSMFENIILYKSEYKTDDSGYRLRFKVDGEDRYVLNVGGEELFYDKANERIFTSDGQALAHAGHQNMVRKIDEYLIPDSDGNYYRQWRDHIHSPDDIWNEITGVINIPGVTSAPKLQPIETRLVMLQTGMRAPMGIKVYGPDLKTIEDFSLKLEGYLKEVPSVKSEAVFADRSLGKPYLELELDRKAIARYGLNIADVQEYIEVALGGMSMSTTVEGRERYNIRARYAREYRNDPEAIQRILVTTSTGTQVPLSEMAKLTYRPGPMMIRSEESFLVGYVLLDKREGFAEVSVVNDAQRYLDEKITSGELQVPAGVSFKFSGSYENQVRAEERLSIVIPLSLMVIFLILYFQFRSVATTLFIFTAIAMAFSGGFLMLWLYGQDWFMNFSLFDTNMRNLFQMREFNLSVAVWVGFIALFGIATDDGVVMATYLKQSFDANRTKTRKEIREAVLQAGMRRVRPCLMTTATTLLALLPILTSTGRGADIMIPMAIPSFGGMVVALITLFIVPVLYSWWQERKVEEAEVRSEKLEDRSEKIETRS
jgi:Cu(I)/Ag(I) efflux system membrane protein CusA/SilA